jgi:hypothetical protein
VKTICWEEPPPYHVIVAQWVKFKVYVDRNIRETEAAANYMFSNYSQFCSAQNFILYKVVQIFLGSTYVYRYIHIENDK